MNEDKMKILSNAYSQGFSALPLAVLRGTMPNHLKLLFLDLLTYAWTGTECFPGHKKLAKDLGVSRRQIVKSMKQLKELGLVTWYRSLNGDSNIYTIYDLPAKFFPKKEAVETGKTRGDVNSSSHGMRTPVHTNNIKEKYKNIIRTAEDTDSSLEKKRILNNSQTTVPAQGENTDSSSRTGGFSAKRLAASPEKVRGVFDYFMEHYHEIKKQSHPHLKEEQLNMVCGRIDEFDREKGEFDISQWRVVVDEYLITDFKQKTDYNINHFTSKGQDGKFHILQHLFERNVM